MEPPKVGSRCLIAENAAFCQAFLPPGVEEVWIDHKIVEAESGGDFLVMPTCVNGPHQPLGGRAVSVFDTAPDAVCIDPGRLVPGASILLPVAGPGMVVSWLFSSPNTAPAAEDVEATDNMLPAFEMPTSRPYILLLAGFNKLCVFILQGVYMNCIVLTLPAANGAVSVLPGHGGKQWEWRSHDDDSVPAGALCVQPVPAADDDESSTSYEALFVLDDSSAVSVSVQQALPGLRLPLFQGVSVEDMK